MSDSKRTYKSSEERAVQIQRAISNGANSLQEVAEVIGVSKSLVKKVMRNKVIAAPFRIKNIEVLMEEKLRKVELSRLVSCIHVVAKRDLSDNERLAYEDSLIVLASYGNRGTSYSFDQFYEFFKRYHCAVESNERVSLSRLGNGIGIRRQGLENFLKRAGRKSLGRDFERTFLSSEDKKTLERAFEVDIPVSDISYFFKGKYNYNTIGTFFKRRSKKGFIRPEIKKIGLYFRNDSGDYPVEEQRDCITYSLASQIYESFDLKFSRENIGELLDVSDRVFSQALLYRGGIGDRIMNSLRVLYPGQRVEKPYINWKVN